MNNIEETAEHLFGEALDLPRDQRPAFLDRVCAGHPHLRQKVDDLLAENDRLSGFLSQPPLPIAASIPALTTETRLLDRYRIVAQLGSGGMGVVY
ncbi:MAG: hypothetical protein WB524_21440, partial [Acidobacteriaceae bacterium]